MSLGFLRIESGPMFSPCELSWIILDQSKGVRLQDFVEHPPGVLDKKALMLRSKLKKP